MDNYLDKCKINCKVAKEGNIYISAEGLLMPVVGQQPYVQMVA